LNEASESLVATIYAICCEVDDLALVRKILSTTELKT